MRSHPFNKKSVLRDRENQKMVTPRPGLVKLIFLDQSLCILLFDFMNSAQGWLPSGVHDFGFPPFSTYRLFV